MDDTTWHCESANIMQNIINDTSELYKFNNIEINTTKSDLLHIKPKFLLNPTPTLSMNQQNIIPRKPQDIIRYLGIFYDGQGSFKPTLDQIQNKIESFLTLIRYKKITPSQISSLFNLILQPSLEYLLQIIPVHTNTQTKFSHLFTIHTKKMLFLAKNTNNIILTNPLTFNLPTFNNIIQKVSAANTERTFNLLPIFKNIGIQRIKGWLTKIWSPQLLAKTLTNHYRKMQNYTLLFHLSQLALNDILPSIISQITPFPSSIPKNTHTIYDILPVNLLTSTINSLRNNKIIFLEQITTANNKNILT
jgi:hypothetical protein